MDPDANPQVLADSIVVTQGDAWISVPPEQQASNQRRGHSVSCLVGGPEYFEAIENEITSILESTADGRFFYMSAWWLGLADVDADITVDPDVFGADFLKNFTDAAEPWIKKIEVPVPGFSFSSGQKLLDGLVAMSQADVDVRVLSWVSPFAPKYKQVADRSEGITLLNLHTLLSTKKLRDDLGKQADHVMLNMLAHPLGGAHLKVVICGDNTSMRAYTGGMDPVVNRLDNTWEDAAVCVQGPAADATYRFFAQLWEEQRRRNPESFKLNGQVILSNLPTTPDVPQRPPFPEQDQTGPAVVQVLRTVPVMNFSVTGPEWLGPNMLQRALLVNTMGFKKDPLSFAPKGIFEFAVALRKLISVARQYIFITDQAFSGQEIMGWLSKRLTDGSGVKIILLHGPDPSDPPSGSMQEAVNSYLLKGAEKAEESTSGYLNLAYYLWQDTVAHSKVCIVDDKACVIGSANPGMRRSLFTDIEHSVSIVDLTGESQVKLLRRKLWARCCGVNASEVPDRVEHALYIWNPVAWNPDAVAEPLKLLEEIQPYPLPIVQAQGYDPDKYAQQDPDSRQQF